MRTLKYAILGLLSQKNMTGYDIYKAFEGTIGNFWSAKHSQIYPELKKLTQEKLITYDISITGEVLEKKVYTLTAEGKAELNDWLNQDEPMEATAKDVFRLRMFFCKDLSPERTLVLLESQIQQHQDRLEYLLETNTQFDHEPKAEELGDFLVLQGAIGREKAYLDWLNNCLPYFKKS